MSRRPQVAEHASTQEIDRSDPNGTRLDADQGPAARTTGRRRRALRIVLAVVVVFAVLAGGGLLAGGFYLRSIESDIERVQAFDAVPEESRPEKVTTATNILILGSDSRDPDSSSGSRSDTIILAHLAADRQSAQLVSIPRDTWVFVPPNRDGSLGGREAKINAAYAWGGIPLMVQTVEEFTGVRIDNVALVDFAGFRAIIDALGGVEIDVEQAFTSTHSLNPDGRRSFAAGPQTMDGAAALDYARERYAFADGDFARIRHQQQVIKAILEKAASGGVLTNPATLNSFIRATADAVAVDETLSLFDTGAELRHLRGDDLTFVTSPTTGTGRVGDESVVFADTEAAATFYDAVRRDAVTEILAAAG
ncbi:LCP family protein [Solwaraspora sp. WMMD406]|uniref:LCP family protein n=1 Tax=Solwaraspora sp. WMMD406 TaxID=3016095 RepID=UPI002417339A|nr:LCP family protein [Solwaraspora sp. WMMD406]MDG4765955.1 LCP family protein [Solwaraspora sp. WMMD406]